MPRCFGGQTGSGALDAARPSASTSGSFERSSSGATFEIHEWKGEQAGRGRQLVAAADMARLARRCKGVAESDDLRLAKQCRGHSGSRYKLGWCGNACFCFADRSPAQAALL